MKTLFALLALVAFTAVAETGTVKEMTPYETNVEWNGFWSTTGHVDTVVSVASSAMTDFSAAVTVAAGANLPDFDTRTTTTDWDDADILIDILKKFGLLLIFR